MAKDYAKQVLAVSRTSKRKQGRMGLSIAILLIVFGCGALVFFYGEKSINFSQQMQGATAFLSKVLSLIHHKIDHPRVTASESHALAMVPNDQASPVHFDFYTELPAMQMQMTESASLLNSQPSKTLSIPALNKAEKVPLAAPTVMLHADQYIVQMGLFKSAAGASQIRLSLLFAGVDTEVIKTDIGDQQIYRVQQGPYATIELAKTMQQRLQKKGIVSVVKKIG